LDPEFQARKQSFIDLGKQVTVEGSYLFPSTIPDGEEPTILEPTIPAGEEPQTFVYKHCCLEGFCQWYCPTHSDQKGKKKEEEPDNKPQRTSIPTS
jgi:hypothetical protein